jgi:hypothetical protein
MAVSSAPLGPKEHPVAIVSGQSSAYYFLGMGPTGDDSIQAAVEDAKQQKNSDTIMNVFVDRKLFCFPVCGFSLVTQVTTRIYGTLVKYDDPWTKENVLPSIHVGDAQQLSDSSPELTAFFKTVKKGDAVILFLKNGKTVQGAFSQVDADHNVWIHGGRGLSASSVELEDIIRAEKEK